MFDVYLHNKSNKYMRTITITKEQDKFLYGKVFGWRTLDRYKWNDEIEKFCLMHQINTKREVMILEHVARAIGIEPKVYDNRPYGDFLDIIHQTLQEIQIVKI